MLVACAGKPAGPMPSAAAQLSTPAAQARGWSQAMAERHARLTDHLASAGVEVLRTRHELDPWVISAGIGFRF